MLTEEIVELAYCQNSKNLADLSQLLEKLPIYLSISRFQGGLKALFAHADFAEKIRVRVILQSGLGPYDSLTKMIDAMVAECAPSVGEQMAAFLDGSALKTEKRKRH